ncbi:MAG: GxxExxY protein [Gemmatimonadaceae bacterium]|nr:GxxExxY protein [Gemmatimonadaceae bacterium]
MAEPDLHLYQTTRVIIGAFYYVFNRLGSGFLESVYHRALGNALERTGCPVVREAALSVVFEGLIVGEFRADLVVDRQVLVEVKAAEHIVAPHEAQVINYLRASGLPVGLLLNFGPRPSYRRFVGPTALVRDHSLRQTDQAVDAEPSN